MDRARVHGRVYGVTAGVEAKVMCVWGAMRRRGLWVKIDTPEPKPKHKAGHTPEPEPSSMDTLALSAKYCVKLRRNSVLRLSSVQIAP